MNSSSRKKPTQDNSQQVHIPFTPPAQVSTTTADAQASLTSFRRLLADYRRASYEWLEYWRQA